MAKQFLGKVLKSIKPWAHPQTINTDKAPTFGPTIDKLKEEGKCPKDTVHRHMKCQNNIIETDHGKIKRFIKPTLILKSMKTAYATIKGNELMCLFKKRKMNAWIYGQRLIGEICLIEGNLVFASA